MSDVWKIMKSIFWYYPVRYSTVTVIRILGYAGLGLVTGVMIKRFFDYSASEALTPGRLYEITALLVVIPLVQAVTYSIDLALSYGWTEIIRSIFRRNLFRFVLEKPGAAPMPVSHGKLMNIVRSDVSVPESLMWDIPYLLAYAIFSLVGLVMLTAIDWTATVALFAPLLLTVLAMRFLKRRIAFHYERQQHTSDRFLGMLSNVFRHHEAIRINNAVKAFMERLSAIGQERAEAGKRNVVFNTVLASVYDNIVNVGTALLLLLIASKMRTGSFSVGSFTLFIYFLGYVSGMIRLIGNTAAGFRKTESALSRIRELLGDDHVRKLANNDSLYLKQEPPSSETPVLEEPLERFEVRNLDCTFQGSASGVHDISFAMPRQSFTVITGPVGSGKTTLLRAMLGLLPVDSGALVWNGRVVAAPAQFFVPPVAGYVPQVPTLFSGTLRDNILLGHPPNDSRLQHALRISALDDDVWRFPEGLDTQLGPKGAALSGGQRQRVAVARMAVRQAELWVLDDSSSALDAETEIRMWERIDALRRSAGITCVVVSTKHYALKYADQVIVMENGRIDNSASRLLV